MIRWLALFCIALGLTLGNALAAADTYSLITGEEYTGEAMGPDARGIIIKKTDGTLTERLGWTNFSQTALKKLSKTLPRANRYIEPLLEDDEPVETKPRAAAPALKYTPPDRMPRPDRKAGGSLFDSPLSCFLIFMLYAANIYAGYEVSKFRNQSPPLVCGLSAVAPVIVPIIYLSMPTRIPPTEEELHPVPENEEPATLDMGTATPQAEEVAGEPGKATLPPPVIYTRGTTSFNRRFFEMTLLKYMRTTPAEEDKDKVLAVKSARGDYIGTRISKALPNEFCLQVEKGGASSEVAIPYAELYELKIRHKDDV